MKHHRRNADCSQITTASQLNSVIFKDKAAAPVGKKFFSLFPGLGYAAGYKVSQNLEFTEGYVLMDIRFCKECTNMVDNHSFETTLPSTTAPSLTELLDPRLERP
jgi:hypothetical protein